MMTAGMLILFGAALLILLPQYPAVVLGFALLGLAKVTFDPSLYAYLADRIPYHRRGRLIAGIELTWGGAILLGAPAMGWVSTASASSLLRPGFVDGPTTQLSATVSAQSYRRA